MGQRQRKKSIEIIDNTNVKTQSLDITGNFVEYFLDFEDGTNEIVISGRIASNNRFHIQDLVLMVTPPVPPANLASVEISSVSGLASVEEKQTLQLSAIVKDVDGETVLNSLVHWESSNEEIAEISATGLVNAIAPGNVTVTVTATRKTSIVDVQYALEVTARPAAFPEKVVLVGYEAVEEPTLTIPLANETVPLQAKVFNQYKEEMTGIDLVWESSDTAVATVSNGTVTLIEGGITTIKVSLLGDAAVFVELELTVDTVAAVLQTIIITPSDFSNLGSANYDGGKERTATINGVEFGTKAITNGTGGNAGKFQTQANNGVFYNITSLGKIQEVILVTSGNATTLYIGNSRLLTNETAKYSPSGNALGNALSTATSTWNITTGDFSHFALKRGGSAAYWTSITIKYYA